MSAETKISEAAHAAEPTCTLSSVPIWLVVLMLGLLYLGVLYLDNCAAGFDSRVYAPYATLQQIQSFQPPSSGGDTFALGKAVYNKPTCAACHQATGQGAPGQYPKLAGSDWVRESQPGRIIRAVLNGMQGGPITVNGESLSYSAAMVPWKDALSDEEIAAVLTYVRKEWGNNAPEVKPERVKEVRQKIKDHPAPYTPEELMKVSPAD